LEDSKVKKVEGAQVRARNSISFDLELFREVV
jgi:hypothetical protein